MFNKFNKKKHYQQMIVNMQSHLANFEFNIFELKTVKEGFRLEYDRLRENVVALEERIKNLQARNAEGDAKEIEDVQKKIQELLNDTKNYETQMTEVDQAIDGVIYTDPEGVTRRHEGVIEKMGKINVKIDMLKEFIAKL